MNDVVAQYFTGIETEKRKTLLALMDEWRESLANKRVQFKDDGKYYSGDAYFYTDGFFPNYYNQQHKVLFVGREARWISGGDYIAAFLGWFKNNDDHNQKFFTRRILQMVQLFKSDGKIEFEQLMTANDYAKKMVEKGDYGFAVMNISKYANEAKDSAKADPKLINKFLKDSQLETRNYFQEELKILDPEYIITANLFDGKIEKKYLDLCFGKLTLLEEYPKASPDGILYEMDLGRKKVKLVDVYHFSSGKPDEACFYTPIKKLLFSDR
jgi:hypothetical protein